MAVKKWVVGHPDRETAKLMAEECEIDAFTALIACERGITNSAELELMLSDEPILCDIHELADIQAAADCINDAVNNDVLIAVFGDYDCDGIVSTTIMYDYLSSRKARVIPYIPDRLSEGYGMNRAAIDILKDKGVGLIITVDNGIACAEEIAYAASLDIKTVVTDHHLPPVILPEAAAVVDPHRTDCASSFKEVCGAQVAFKVVCAVDGKEPEQLLYRYADLLAVAIVGDVMALVNENRSIVKEGIKLIKHKPRVGISAILSVAGIDRNTVNSGKIAFGIVPRINAAGRMGNPEDAFKLLNCSNMLEALNMANQIDALNSERQGTEKKITTEAFRIIEENKYRYDKVIVVSGEAWHLGVIGIVASRITEKYGKPSIVISYQNGEAHGSGRSISGFHLYDALNACSDSLSKYGGHELAAGLSLETDKIAEFRALINNYAAAIPAVVPQLKLDFRINPSGLSVDMADAVKELEPFGMGNPAPIFGIFDVRLDKINPIGQNKHLKLLLSKNGTSFQALLFGVSPEKFCFEIGDMLDLAVSLDTNFFRDEYTLSVQIKALRMSGTDDDLLLSDLSAYEDFLSDRDYEAVRLLPSREEIGVIYKHLTKGVSDMERLKYIYSSNPGFAKTAVAIDVLVELGLAKLEGSKLYAVNTKQKAELLNSETYKRLYEGVNGQ